jgi:hypothetical protein
LLVAPFSTPVLEARACFIITSSFAAGKPHVEAFIQWLLDEAKRDAENGLPPLARP